MNFALIAAAALAVGNPGEFRYGANDSTNASQSNTSGASKSAEGARNGETVLLDFRADWCGPCRSMDPVIAQLKAQGYPVRQVNVDQERALANKFHVSPIPCFVLLVNGKEVDRAIGAGDDAGHSRDVGHFVAMFRRNGVSPGSNSARGSSLVAADGSAGPMNQAIPFPVSNRSDVAANRNNANQNESTGNRSEVLGGRDTTAESAGYDKLIRCSVRLRIEDETGNSVGSGTIIDSRAGEALIVTCGHVFRDAAKEGRIMVDLFGPNAPQQVPGHLIDYDLKSEVGLVSITTNYPVAVAKLAPPNYKVRTGDHVVSVGCDGGAAATAKETHVVSLNRYVGSPNLEVAFQPVQGRSGGGLFTPDGRVVGVCYAADPEGGEGLFSALAALDDELNHAGLDFIAKGSTVAGRLNDDADLMPTKRRNPRAALDDHSWEKLAAQSADFDSPKPQSAPTARSASPTTRNTAAENLTPVEQATLTLMRDRSPGNDVICFIRPQGNSQAQGEVLVMDQATAETMQQLADQQTGNSPRQLTSLEVPRTAAGPSRGSSESTNVRKPSIADQLRQRGPWWDELLNP